MIPLKVAKALQLIMTMEKQPDGYGGGVRLISDDGDTLVFAETLNSISCMQVLFDSAEMEDGEWDVLITREALESFVRRGGAMEPDFVDFDEDLWPPDVEGALNLSQAVRGPEGVSFWERSGMQLCFLRRITMALGELYGDNAKIKIEQQAYQGAISFFVELSDDEPIEATIFLTAYLMWDGET